MFLPKIGSGPDCIDTIFLSMGGISLTQQSMSVVQNKMSTARFSTTPNHVRTSRFSHLLDRQRDPVYLDRLFRCSPKHGGIEKLNATFQCSLRLASLIRLRPALVSTKHVVEYTTDLFNPMIFIVFYLGLAWKVTSVGGTSNSTSEASVSVDSDSTVWPPLVVMPCVITVSESVSTRKVTVASSVDSLSGGSNSVALAVTTTSRLVGRSSFFAEWCAR